MGEPIFKLKNTVAWYGVEVFSSNYELYGEMSARMMDVLSDFTPEVENYSIDEAFMRLESERNFSFTDLGREIRERVKKHIGIPVSVGIAETKTLAKIANFHAKRSAKAQGVLDLTKSPHQPIALERTPVEEVWGVGPRYGELLRAHGIYNALDLRNADDNFIRHQMTVVGLRTVHELRGINCIPLELCPPSKKSITVSRSFGDGVESWEEMRAALAYYVSRAGEKLRKQKLAPGAITVFISTSRFIDALEQYSNAATLKVAPASDNTFELMQLAQKCLAGIYCDGYTYRKAGVTLTNLSPADTLSGRLWGNEQHERMRKLNEVVDSINRKLGKDTVKFGLFESQGLWQTRFSKRSPRYTTKWDELLEVR